MTARPTGRTIRGETSSSRPNRTYAMSATAVRAHPRAGANGGGPARAADVFVAFGMELAAEGGEGPAPHEGLLHAPMNGGSAPFTRQEGIGEAGGGMPPPPGAPPPGHPPA